LPVFDSEFEIFDSDLDEVVAKFETFDSEIQVLVAGSASLVHEGKWRLPTFGGAVAAWLP
jgi:hypothetical protein